MNSECPVAFEACGVIELVGSGVVWKLGELTAVLQQVSAFIAMEGWLQVHEPTCTLFLVLVLGVQDLAEEEVLTAISLFIFVESGRIKRLGVVIGLDDANTFLNSSGPNQHPQV